MKKLFFLTAIVSLLFVGCNNDNGDYDPNDPSRETVRLLPARIIVDRDTTFFEYDQWNRLVRIIDNFGMFFEDTIEIGYDLNHNPIRVEYISRWISATQTLRYSDNQIFVFGPEYATWGSGQGNMHWGTFDTLTLNSNGRITGWTSIVINQGSGFSGGHPSLGGTHRAETSLFYDADGHLTRLQVSSTNRTAHVNSPGDTNVNYWSGQVEVNIAHTQSTTRDIWRHVNMPNWLFSFLDGIGAGYDTRSRLSGMYLVLNKNRVDFMPSQIVLNSTTQSQWDNTEGQGQVEFAHILDANGYVTQMQIVERSDDGASYSVTVTIEWIPAR